eukprot:TRINITY_DN3945_c0_g3_i1.p1 TRINITY_DN3945_c0_g3~~TRINITY_DN3945_c0_g3_i1.p1  ORF type:complete len:517 (-),score=81.83 TRINITY_DN3945_c0_g3_i1:102-1652(-)
MNDFGNRFIFPAPEASYGSNSYKRHLCWIPWNEVISGSKRSEEGCGDGIPCLWFPAPKAATVILFFHANAEDLGMSFAVLKHMRDQFKVNVLAVEYPGYGLLRGMMPSEEGIYEVALTAFRFLVDEVGVRYSQIILFGRSLGTGPAVHLAALYPVGGLIVVSAFSSIKAAVQSIGGRFLAWTFKERFPNSKIITNVSCSTLFIHGECDGLIPPEHSVRLFKRCRARKLLITPPKMEHNSNLFADANFLAVPAIHFFGFPGYYTTTPPRLPAFVFENPERRARMRDGIVQEVSAHLPWLCGCLAKGDTYHMDVSLYKNAQEPAVEAASAQAQRRWAEPDASLVATRANSADFRVHLREAEATSDATAQLEGRALGPGRGGAEAVPGRQEEAESFGSRSTSVSPGLRSRGAPRSSELDGGVGWTVEGQLDALESTIPVVEEEDASLIVDVDAIGKARHQPTAESPGGSVVSPSSATAPPALVPAQLGGTFGLAREGRERLAVEQESLDDFSEDARVGI